MTEAFGFIPISAAEKAVAREAMILWDDLIPQKIVEKNGNGADIILANTTTGPAQAHAYFPGNGPKIQGDVWTADPSVNWTNAWLQYDGYGRTTLIHEIGHSLGLNHPGNYNFGDDGPDPDTLPDPITYEADAFYAQDTKQYTIMSYFSAQKTGAQPINAPSGILGNPQTPLLHDILTIQAKYGADPTTRAGDTNLFLQLERGQRGLRSRPEPLSPICRSMTPAARTRSTSRRRTRGVFIDLRPGSFSSAAKGCVTLAQANAVTAEFNAATDASTRATSRSTAPQAMRAEVNSSGASAHNRVLQPTPASPASSPRAPQHLDRLQHDHRECERRLGARLSVRQRRRQQAERQRRQRRAGRRSRATTSYTGGAGADEFRVSEIGGNDKIIDFASGVDKIRLTEIDANTRRRRQPGLHLHRQCRVQRRAGQLRSYSQGGDNYLAGDVNGDGLADFTINTGAAPPRGRRHLPLGSRPTKKGGPAAHAAGPFFLPGRRRGGSATAAAINARRATVFDGSRAALAVMDSRPWGNGPRSCWRGAGRGRTASRRRTAWRRRR